MSVDPALILSVPVSEKDVEYNAREVIMYNLGIGAHESKFVYEGDSDFAMIPTYSTCWSFKGDSYDIVQFGEGQLDRFPGMSFNPMMILHGEQETEVYKTLPTSGRFVNKTRNIGCYDKGSGAVIVSETLHCDRNTGEVYARNVGSTFIRGAGGFGGDRGPSSKSQPLPNRDPDVVFVETTSEHQAQIYRLSGDYNPLHIDESMAQMVGFKKPILHGLCTYGFAARAVLINFCNNDTRLFKSFKTRFASSVYPGDTFITKMWKNGNTVRVHMEVEGGTKPVLDNCFFELNPTEVGINEIALSGPHLESQVIFDAMDSAIKSNPGLVSKLNAVFQFNLTTSDGSVAEVVVDVKNGNGGVSYQRADKADCTITMSDTDYFRMATGELNAQQAFMSGKMKIKGNIMLAQKLSMISDSAKL